MSKLWERLRCHSIRLVRYGAREGNITMELALASDVMTTFEIPFKAKELGNPEYSDRKVLRRFRQEKFLTPLVVNFDQNRIGGLESD